VRFEVYHLVNLASSPLGLTWSHQSYGSGPGVIGTGLVGGFAGGSDETEPSTLAYSVGGGGLLGGVGGSCLVIAQSEKCRDALAPRLWQRALATQGFAPHRFATRRNSPRRGAPPRSAPLRPASRHGATQRMGAAR